MVGSTILLHGDYTIRSFACVRKQLETFMMSAILRLPAEARWAVFAPHLNSALVRQSSTLSRCLVAPAVTALSTRGPSFRTYATVHLDAEKHWNEPSSLNKLQGQSPGDSDLSINPTTPDTPPQVSCEQERLSRTILQALQKAEKRKSRGKPSWREALRAEVDAALSSPDRLERLITLAKSRGVALPTTATSPDSSQGGTDSRNQASSLPKAPERPAETEILQNVAYIEQHFSLPKKEQYPDALPDLFDSSRVFVALNNRCAQLKLSLDTEASFSFQGTPANPRHSCEVKLQIPDICEEVGTGDGKTKAAAKQAACLHVVAKLHASGALKELWPSPEPESVGTIDSTEHNEVALEPANVQKQTLEDEKDAKGDIYSFAASYYAVPEFGAERVRALTRRARLAKQTKSLIRVSIKLKELGLSVVAIDQSLPTAEVAAALAFKRQAEQRLTADAPEDLRMPKAKQTVLSTNTAKSFFDFYKSFKGRANVEIEYDQISVAGTTQNSARLTIDGELVGDTVRMRTKKQAESVAYLLAAIEVARKDPHLVEQFEHSLKKGKGKVLRDLPVIDLEADYDTLAVMRDALMEARRAGLSDTREVLTAEEFDSNDVRQQRRRKTLSPTQVARANRLLFARQQAFAKNHDLEELRSKKAALPMNQYQERVLSMVSENLYSIIVGATGSGKTTQVPQILLDHAIKNGHGGECNIICTQPRRIAASSVAQRVAVERDENLQETVGYHVRFDAKLPDPGGSITYCTTGILLESLKHDPDGVFDTVSHIIIDEVHERDLFIDFLMIVVKKIAKARRNAGKSVPKIVLMSATLDTDLFAQYFGQVEDGRLLPCPSVSVPGRTFPVQEKHLGSIMLDLISHDQPTMRNLVDEDKVLKQYLEAETNFSTENSLDKPSASVSAIDWKRERQPVKEWEEGVTAAQEKEDALVPVALVAATIAHICSTTEDGAILAFVPGLEEIVKAQRLLTERTLFGVDFNDAAKYRVNLLHSSIPKEQQSEIFERLPPRCRRIILSTNIAETSVTVADVKYVVDAGKLREKMYDQVRRITKLQCVWESKSNAKQRAGRAGRVQKGYYYALFSRERHNSMRDSGLPELLRSDLQTTALSIKAQRYGEPVASFLAQAIEPPPPPAVTAAVNNLKALEAFTQDEEMTDLGRVLSKLPVHPTLGKMILLGIIFRCLDPMLTLGAAAEERSLFVTPLERREEARAAHKTYSGQQSDHLALIEAFRELRNLRNDYGMHAVHQRARDKFLHAGAFSSIDNTARLIEQILVEVGLIDSDRRNRSTQYGGADLNQNARNHLLVKSLLLAGFHPNLAAKQSSKGVVFRTGTEQDVMIHPGSINAIRSKARGQDERPKGTLFAYSALSRSNDGRSLFLRDSTLVTPLMSVIFGGKLQISNYNRLEVDEWLPFFVKADDRQYATKLILEFRKALDRVLNGAFRSLADLDPRDPGHFTADPMREHFARKVVAVLNKSHTPVGNFWSQQRTSAQL